MRAGKPLAVLRGDGLTTGRGAGGVLGSGCLPRPPRQMWRRAKTREEAAWVPLLWLRNQAQVLFSMDWSGCPICLVKLRLVLEDGFAFLTMGWVLSVSGAQTQTSGCWKVKVCWKPAAAQGPGPSSFSAHTDLAW